MENQKPVNRIGKMLKKYRDKTGLTQAEVAKALNYKYGNFIGMLETGNAVFPLAKGKWLEYAKMLDVDPTEFVLIALCDVHPEMEPYLTPLLEKLKGGRKTKRA